MAAIERLAAEGASPDAKGHEFHGSGLPAVCRAACAGHAGAVSALVRLGTDLDATNSDGWTALMWAAWYGEVECVRALLAGGADRTLQATRHWAKGKTALEIAQEGNQLWQSGAELSARKQRCAEVEALRSDSRCRHVRGT
eukprot:COSAG04_NODE_10804_length_752_cov_0.863706_2_plen_141_part_00